MGSFHLNKLSKEERAGLERVKDNFEVMRQRSRRR